MKATRFFALGGMMEIGKTTMVVEHDNEIVIIDAGIKFTNSMETGAEGIIPDYTYLQENEDKIKALVITHGHMDHIGGIQYLVRQVNIKKIIAPRLAIKYIMKKFKEFKITQDIEFVEIEKDDVHTFENIKVDFWTSQHSIPDSFGIRVTTPNGSIFDTGDFRFDFTPIGNMTDFTQLEKFQKEGIDILISDSTNSMSPDWSPTEQKILVDIEKFVSEAKGKVVFATFSSNLNRVKAVIDIAVKQKRRVAVFGRSMVDAIEIGKSLKWIDVPDSTFIDKRQLSSVPDDKILILSTGSQGEEMAALSRMATGKHPQVNLRKGDLVLFSSSPIPGNRLKIEELINKLYKVGAEIKENKIDGLLHTSGHAYKDEHDEIFQKTKPKYFVPYHGAYRQSAVHGHTAIENGIPKENVFLIENGEVLELKDHVLTRSGEKIEVGPVYIDGNVANTQTSAVINQRAYLAENGFINVAVVINKDKNEIVGRTRIITRGSLYVRESYDFINEIQKIAHGAILYTIKNNKNWTTDDVKKIIKSRVEPKFYSVKRRRPLVITTVIDYKKDQNSNFKREPKREPRREFPKKNNQEK